MNRSVCNLALAALFISFYGGVSHAQEAESLELTMTMLPENSEQNTNNEFETSGFSRSNAEATMERADLSASSGEPEPELSSQPRADDMVLIDRLEREVIELNGLGTNDGPESVDMMESIRSQAASELADLAPLEGNDGLLGGLEELLGSLL